MAERRLRIADVVGSIPTASTMPKSNLEKDLYFIGLKFETGSGVREVTGHTDYSASVQADR